MRDRHNGGVLERERDGRNGLDAGQEAVNQDLLVDIKNIRGEDVALVKDLDDRHSVRERRDVQHVQQRRFGRADTGAGSDDLHVADDFDRTTRNLRRDTEGLEERGLAGFHTGVSSGDNNVDRGERTSTSGGGDLVRSDDSADLLEITVREDKADVALDVGEQALELGVLGEDGAERTSDHGVLAHENDTLATEGDTDLMHLVRAHIVNVDQEDGRWK